METRRGHRPVFRAGRGRRFATGLATALLLGALLGGRGIAGSAAADGSAEPPTALASPTEPPVESGADSPTAEPTPTPMEPIALVDGPIPGGDDDGTASSEPTSTPTAPEDSLAQSTAPGTEDPAPSESPSSPTPTVSAAASVTVEAPTAPTTVVPGQTVDQLFVVSNPTDVATTVRLVVQTTRPEWPTALLDAHGAPVADPLRLEAGVSVAVIARTRVPASAYAGEGAAIGLNADTVADRK